ncbi:ERAD-associated protein [Emmonsiellopsis sp. PD_33]|nr:ERAD-associated protein [Emmonsiellopsis sp. PD_33]
MGASSESQNFWQRRIFLGGRSSPYPTKVSNEEEKEDENLLPLNSPNPSDTASFDIKEDSYFFPGTSRGFPRISRPVELLRPAYDVVVVGSGYGGGVAASRMARGGQSVCLLELGREKWPGEYPTTAAEAAPEFHISGAFSAFDMKGRYTNVGDSQGLYHLVLGQGQNAFMANGLGGTSLINANVFLEADQGILNTREWPESMREEESLRIYYDRARDMLQPEPYPKSSPDLYKLNVLKKQAESIGGNRKFYQVPQTTRFENGVNNTGVDMNASTLSGMDATGINDGSKSSTLVNYLADAWNWGAEMFCGCEVRYVKKHPTQEGYLVFFAWHGGGRAKFKDEFHHDLMWVHAKKFVFLGAGALGTTEILLRSKNQGLKMSDRVGTHMSGNGDILAFGYNTDFEVNAMGRAKGNPKNPVGPTVTGVIDCRDQPNPLEGFIIEDGAVPEALVRGLHWQLMMTPGKVYPGNRSMLNKIQKVLAAGKSAILGPYTRGGSMQNTQVYLVMSHDSSQALLSLADDKPVLQFRGVGQSERVKSLNDMLAKMTDDIGGTFINNPFFAALGKQQVTVHPMGGANMSRDGTGEQGATSEFGELLSGNGRDIHNGIVVVDGALVPSSLGVNPLATITALAERSVEAVAHKHGIVIDYDTKNGILDLFGPASKSLPILDDKYHHAVSLIKGAHALTTREIEFSEIMTGYMYIGDDICDHVTAAKAANGSCSSARLFVSVRSWDIDSLTSSDKHHAMLTGSFACGSLPGSPFLILRGDFRLFQTDPRTPDTTNIIYDFDMISSEGDRIHFYGEKIIDPSVTLSPRRVWKAASTLYATLTRRADNVVISRGILNLEPSKFVSELRTLIGAGQDQTSKTGALIKFLKYFSKQLGRPFLSPFRHLQWPQPTPKRFRYEKTPPSQTIELIALDGVSTTLNVWDPVAAKDDSSENVPEGTPILMVCGASVTDDIFAMPTLETNAAEFFTRLGFRVYTLTPRFGITPVAHRGFTAFDARLDVHAALAKVRALQELNEPIYVVAHCVGALAFSMGLLDGTIPASWIAGITVSQVFLDPIAGKINRLKARLPLIEMLWCHHNLNEETHANLSTFLGGISTRTLSHLVEMTRRGYVMNNEGESLVTDINLNRLRGIPILFFSGAENVVFSPLSTEASYSKLRRLFGGGDYDRVEFPGRGHLDCWMGTNAAIVALAGAAHEDSRTATDISTNPSTSQTDIPPGFGLSDTGDWRDRDADGQPAVDAALNILRNIKVPAKKFDRPSGFLGYTRHYAREVFYFLFMNGPPIDSPTRIESETIKLSPELKEAVSLLQDAAEQENSDAIFLLAEMNFYGNFTHPRNYRRAFELYQELATLEGNSTAQYMLGFMYATGIGGAVERHQGQALLYHTFAAMGGNIRSQMTVAFRRYLGIGTPHDCDQAAFYYKQVADQAMAYYRSGPPGGQLLVKESYRWADDEGGVYGEGASASSSGPNAKESHHSSSDASLEDVLEYLDLLAKKGDIKATFSLGRMYYEGSRNLKRNVRKAMRYFGLVAKKFWTKDGKINSNHPAGIEKTAAKAAAHIGLMFLRGEGTEQNFEKALTWFQRGRALGDPMCQHNMGLMYLHGYGVPQDAMKAASYFKAASEQDFPASETRLGALFLDQGDVATATKYFELAARYGWIEAFYYLAEMAEQGLGRFRHCGMATAYYKMVAEKAEIIHSSFHEANEAYENGDTETALVAAMMAAEQGYENAQANVAYLLDDQRSVLPLNSLLPGSQKQQPSFLRNAALALIYWTRSARQSNIDSLVKMGDYYFYGYGTERDLDKAFTCYHSASEGYHSAQAFWNLGWMHENGYATEQDFHMAKRFYDLALDTNYEAYLPVKLSLIKLRIRSFWNRITNGKVNPIRSEPDSKAPRSFKEWITAFVTYDEDDDEEPYHQHKLKPQSDPDAPDSDLSADDPDTTRQETGGRRDPEGNNYYDEYDFEMDDGVAESLIIIGLAATLVILVYFRQQRALQRVHGNAAAQPAAAAAAGGGGGGAQPAAGEQRRGGEDRDRGLFPQRDDPDFNAWVAGGVGH